LQTYFLRGLSEAIRFVGGAKGLGSVSSPVDLPILFELEAQGVVWRLEISPEGEGVHLYNGERVTVDGNVLLEVPLFQAHYELNGVPRSRSPRAELDTLYTIQPTPALKEFCDMVRGMRIFSDEHLREFGPDALSLLRMARSSPRGFEHLFDWVLEGLKEAFPEVIEDLDLANEQAPAFHPKGAPDPKTTIPLHLAASGLLTGLHQLVAVAGVGKGALVALDEMENQLHPHAIRVILRRIRERAEERQLTVVLTTHSPVVMNEFKGYEDQFYVLGSAAGMPNPASLLEIHDSDWLAHFSLGDLYEREEFASPRVSGR